MRSRGEVSTHRTPDERGPPRRLIVAAEGAFAAHSLPESGSLVVGRGSAAQLPIADLSVSRRHARLHFAPGETSVEDLGSPNGTYLNGARLPPLERRPLRAGDALRLGSVGMFLQAEGTEPLAAADPVVTSSVMKKVFALVDRIAGSSLSVLIRGETGTGKEVVAGRLHASSPRRHGPFLAIDCGALPEAIFESEIFGFERDAFSGATEPKRGLLESANGGTLFLDEVGELPVVVQAKLLRALEEREVRPLGASTPRRIDVRIVAATNRDLEAPGSTFRSDLYFRIAGAIVTVPPLRERKDEVVPLAEHFLARLASELGTRPPALAAEAVAVLERHSWPGNVRELRNAMQHALVFATGDVVSPGHLPGTIGGRPEAPLDGETDERSLIEAALDACGGNQTSAARRLGIPRRTFLRKLDRYGLSRPRKPPRPG